jgi:glucosamine-6-phosphate deaminase
MEMLKIAPNVPLKETHSYLAGFPRFSLIEKIEPKFFPSSVEASRKVAEEIRDAIRAKAYRTKDPFVLGLATGSTPLKVYKELISMVAKGELSFKNVITFNLDEYYPITKDNIESYNFYMRSNLFNHIDIPAENINIPDGEIPRERVSKFCEDYERKIRNVGGIDLQILGIGRTGHIGFNEPPSPSKSTTRLVYLHRLTRKDAANSFNGIEHVPKCAITMGIDTIGRAKKIIIMAWGENKTFIVKRSIEGAQSADIPSTFLHSHPDATFYLDKAAGEELSRFRVPWTIKGDREDPIVPNSKYWISKMVFWLCREVRKPILRLSFEDYEDHGLSPLVMDVAHGSVEDLNLFAYRQLHRKITGWPLGDRPAETSPAKENYLQKTSLKTERVLIFSPHPDDDVISMGGTIARLLEQGHEVMVAYMTTGSNSVHDYEALKYLHLMKDFLGYLRKLERVQGAHPKPIKRKKDAEQNGDNADHATNGADHVTNGVANGINGSNHESESELSKVAELLDEAQQSLHDKKHDNLLVDTEVVRVIKGLIRSSEAKIAVETFGIMPKDVHCMELPFYCHHSGRKDAGEADQQIIRNLLSTVEPTVIYAAGTECDILGDLDDPHGTHRKCLQTLLKVHAEEAERCRRDAAHVSLFPNPDHIFFYRGAWE